jgi:anti-anti-sigma factor
MPMLVGIGARPYRARVADETFRVELSDDLDGARLVGELDLLGYEKADLALSPLFEAPGDVTLDVSDLTFIDSSGIRLLVRLERSIRDRGVLHLRGASPHIARVFQVAGLPDLGITVEEARDA